MLKDEFFQSAAVACIQGLLSNPQNVNAKVGDIVDQALEAAAQLTVRIESYVTLAQPAVLTTSATAATLSYGVTKTAQANTTPKAVLTNTAPTMIKQPGVDLTARPSASDSIAGQQY